MIKRWRLKLNNQVMAWLGVFGVGLLPCPDCGIPLAVHVWPVAGVVWVWRRVRRRADRIDLFLSDDLQQRSVAPSHDAHDHREHEHVTQARQ